MSRTYINVSAASSANNTIKKVKDNVANVLNSFCSTKNNVDSKIQNRNNIGGRMNSVQNQLNSVANEVNRISATVSGSLNLYNSTDMQIAERGRVVCASIVETKRSSYYDMFLGGYGGNNDDYKIKEKTIYFDEIENIINKFLSGITEEEIEEVKKRYGISDIESLKDILSDPDNMSDEEIALLAEIQNNPDEEDQRSLFAKFINNELIKEYSVISGEISGEGKFLGINTAGTMSGDILALELGVKSKAAFNFKNEDGSWNFDTFGFTTEAKAQGTVAQGEMEGNFGYLNGKLEGKFLTGAVKGECRALLWEDGKFRPSLSIGAGAEVSVLQGEAEVGLGTDQFGIKGKADGDFLHAEADAKAGIGYIGEDKNGNAMYGVAAEASAMASVAQGKVGGGITLFGIDVDVDVKGYACAAGVEAGGSISTKGVKATFSGALLLGAGLDVSVDWSDAKWIGDTVDAVGDFVSDAVDFTGDAIDYIGDATVNAYNVASDFVGDAAEATYDFASNVYHGAINTAGKVGDYLFGWI